MEIDTKSSQTTYEVQKLVNVWNLMKKTEKNAELGPIKLVFSQTHMKLAVAIATLKMMDTIDISKFTRRMNKQTLLFFGLFNLSKNNKLRF